MNDIFLDSSADVRESARLGKGSRVWGLAHVGEKATIGDNCIIGRGAFIGTGVELGENCKVQNAALVYGPAVIENGVLIGPGAILTNDQFPRAVTIEGELKNADDWVPVGVIVREGASVGAGAICVAPVTIGAWAMVGA